MITGDDGLTAAAIGREIGLNGEKPLVVSGAELESLDDASLARLMQGSEVLFARVSPEHKLRLVEILQQQGEVVAVPAMVLMTLPHSSGPISVC
jgi:magnesium-transporting ATPase (P-type)